MEMRALPQKPRSGTRAALREIHGASSLSCTLVTVMPLGDSHAAQGQRPGNKPAQGNALGKPSITDKALKGRDTIFHN